MTYWWYNLPEALRFRVRFLIFEAIIGVLILIVSQQGVIPLWATIGLVMASGMLTIVFITQYGVTERRFAQQGLDIEGRDRPWQ